MSWIISVSMLSETDIKSLSIDMLESLLQLQEICVSDNEKLSGEKSGVKDIECEASCFSGDKEFAGVASYFSRMEIFFPS